MEAAPDTLLIGLLDGEVWAYEAIVDEFGPAVRAVTAGYRLSAADRDEVFQATFLSLLESRSSIRHSGTLPGWLVKVATHHCLKSRRRLETPIEISGEVDAEVGAVLPLAAPPSDPATTHGSPYDDDERRAVSRAIRGLSDRDLRLLVLLFGEPSHPYHQIAELLGISVGSVGPLRARILSRLRSHPDVRARLGERALESA